MQTLLSRFCDEFVRVVRPLVGPLGQSVDAMSAATNGVPGKEIQSSLMDLRHQVDALCEKVSQQQAYVMIFGPLKSGKSTLMNALAGSYVSEVTSLPAYPCMIFVAGGEKHEFTLEDYNGKTQMFRDAAKFHAHADKAHSQLARRIREVEALGKQFDPKAHFPEAIRRIDVRLPAGDLARSAAVFVDTPGLYSRMRFGYDRMTRDFRDAAACAVFVVRSDNLYLEQVFEEFNKLLELFSKIFLVVNLDTDKKDLQPDGTLVPSLEQKDPARLIEAFENLTMSAPLKKAAEEGRLRIFPVGLLHAASRRLRGKKAEENVDSERDFERFRKELTEYLDSPDYLLAFLGDSLRRATTLLEEAVQICDHGDLKTLRGKVQDLERQERDALAQLNGIAELETLPWRDSFHELQTSMAPVLGQLAAEIGEKTGRGVEATLQTWFKSGASLESLVKGDLVELFMECQKELTQAFSKELSERVVAGRAGVEVSDAVNEKLRAIGIDLDTIGSEVHKTTDRDALVTVPPTPVRAEHIPVRKGMGDLFLFRSMPAVRRRLFGAPDKPVRNIPKEVKASRLGEPAMAALRQRLNSYSRGFFADTVTRMQHDFLGAYCRKTKDAVTALIDEKKSVLKERIDGLQAEQESIGEMLEPMGDLQRRSGRALQAVNRLSKHYGQVDMFLLTKPVEIPGLKPGGASRTGDIRAMPPRATDRGRIDKP